MSKLSQAMSKIIIEYWGPLLDRDLDFSENQVTDMVAEEKYVFRHCSECKQRPESAQNDGEQLPGPRSRFFEHKKNTEKVCCGHRQNSP